MRLSVVQEIKCCYYKLHVSFATLTSFREKVLSSERMGTPLPITKHLGISIDQLLGLHAHVTSSLIQTKNTTKNVALMNIE